MSNLNPADLPENVSPEMLDWEFWEDLYRQPSAVVQDAWDDEYDAIHGYDDGYDVFDDYEPQEVTVDQPEKDEWDGFDELYDEFDDFDPDDEVDWDDDWMRSDWLLWHASIRHLKTEIPFDIAVEFERLPKTIGTRRDILIRLRDGFYRRDSRRFTARRKWNKKWRRERQIAARWRQERLAEFQKQDLMEIIRPVRRISHLDLLDEDGY